MTPTTEAGKRLIADCEGGGIPASGSLGSHIAAIEQEARAAALRDDSAATIDRWVDALTEIAALRAALEAWRDAKDAFILAPWRKNLQIALQDAEDALRAALATAKKTTE